MGRPVQDKFFTPVGDTPGGKTGKQINVVSASYTDGPTNDGNSWIVRQRSTKRFEITNGEDIEVLTLFNATGSVPTVVFDLRVLPFEGGSEYASGLTNHLVKTFQGNSYKWDHLKDGLTASADDEANFDPTMS